MKFVKKLSSLEEEWLNQIEQSEFSSRRAIQRSQAIRLSNKGYRIVDLSEIYEVSRDTVSRWLESWNKFGFDSVEDRHRSGRPPILESSEQEQILEWVKESPRQSKTVLNQIQSHFKKGLCAKTLTRFLKKKTTAGVGVESP